MTLDEHDPLSTRLARTLARIRTDLPLAILDTLLVAATYSGMLVLRFEGIGPVPEQYVNELPAVLLVAVPVHLLANWMWGLYGQMWRHASVQEARRIVLAGATAGLAIALITQPGGSPLPRLALGLSVPTATILMGAVRFQSRLFAFRRGGDRRRATRVVVVGAGSTGGAIVREMLRDPSSGLLPVALLDDDPRKQGRESQGVPVVGGIGALEAAVARHEADEALLAIASADGKLVRRVANAADAAGVPLKVLPSVNKLVDGQVSVRDVRDLEITDLLGRTQVTTDLAAVAAMLRDRRVLITGAGGSIGSEIARQVAEFRPGRLVLLDCDETHLHDAAAAVDGPCVQVLGDIRDVSGLRGVFESHRPQVVFHAAAYKHVPILEGHPCQAIRTNVLGTRNVVDACTTYCVQRLVFVSTDKAVQPVNVMGASKRVCEQLVIAHARADRAYCAVRFGNVLGSRGSVVPRFMDQINRGRAVTVTDERMTRYFMSIPEAVQLVLQAATFADGDGEIFTLEMGEPVAIIDLAKRMIRLSGRKVGTDIPVRITGLRPGERLTEKLHAPDESPEPTAHPSITMVHPAAQGPEVLATGVAHLERIAADRDDKEAARALHDLASGRPVLIDLPEAHDALTAGQQAQMGHRSAG